MKWGFTYRISEIGLYEQPKRNRALILGGIEVTFPFLAGAALRINVYHVKNVTLGLVLYNMIYMIGYFTVSEIAYSLFHRPSSVK